MHFAAMGAYLPYFPAWLEARGIHGFRMSVIVALLPALSVVSPSMFGVLADAFGWRGSLLRIATLGACTAFALLALCLPSASNSAFLLLFAAVFAFGFFRTPMQLLGEVVALEVASDYGKVRMWGSIGFMLAAPLVGRFIPLEPAWVLPACIALLFAATHAASFGLPTNADLPSTPAIAEVRRLLSQPGYGSFLLVTVLGHGAHVAYELCLSLRLRDLGVSGAWIGAAWTIATLAEVLMLGFSRHLLTRYPVALLLFVSLLGTALRLLVLSRLQSLSWLLPLQPLHAITFGLRWVASMALVRSFAARNAMATSQGLFLTATALGTAAGMLLWGTLHHRLGAAVFLWAGAVALAAAFATVPLLRERQRIVTPASSSVDGLTRPE
jgi:MFS transporter, PPP family, 3-phenylpropionic acid transporter